MTLPPDFGTMMAAWAEKTPSVSGLVLIGSRERPPSETLETADGHADWDFQVITSAPRMFGSREWTAGLAGARLLAYSARVAVIGGVPKITAVFQGAEVDLVIIPEKVIRRIKLRTAFGRHRKEGWTRRRLQDLAEVIRPGWRFLKGEERWGALYRRAVAEVPDPRLEDGAARQLAEGFVCDYVWTLRKLARGELRTAQRMLYRELAETNLQLLHELRRRRDQRTFTKARRIEWVATPAELASVTVEATVEAAALRAALEKAAATCRELMRGLVGDAWRWPDVR